MKQKLFSIFFLFSIPAFSSTCCVCEFLNKPMEMLKTASEARLVPLAKKNCQEDLNKEVCDFKLLVEPFGPETKKISREQWKNFKMLGEDVRKKIISWAEPKACEKVFYIYHGHSWNDRGKDFVDSSFALKNQLSASVVSCTNNGCRTFQDVVGMRKYFAEKCSGNSCSPGSVFQIRANLKDFKPSNRNYSHSVLREQDKVSEGGAEDVILPNVRAHGVAGGIEKNVFLIEDADQ
jgi:hypothetical protein